MVFLHSNGVGTARAVSNFKTYGADTVQVMTEDPYLHARDIRGIGFKSADAMAMKLGIEKTAMIRLRAGISYALTEAMTRSLRTADGSIDPTRGRIARSAEGIDSDGPRTRTIRRRGDRRQGRRHRLHLPGGPLQGGASDRRAADPHRKRQDALGMRLGFDPKLSCLLGSLWGRRSPERSRN